MEKTFDEILTGAEQIEQKHSLWEVSERLKALAIDFRTQIHSVQANAEDKALDLLQIVEHYKDKLHLNADTEEKAFAFLTKVEEMSERMEQYANGLEAKVDEGQLQMHLAYS